MKIMKVDPDFDEPSGTYITQSKENFDNLSDNEKEEVEKFLNSINIVLSSGICLTIEKNGVEIIKVYSLIDRHMVLGN